MKLQKNTRLALYSVLEFALDPSRHVAAAEIAGKYGVSPHHPVSVARTHRAPRAATSAACHAIPAPISRA